MWERFGLLFWRNFGDVSELWFRFQRLNYLCTSALLMYVQLSCATLACDLRVGVLFARLLNLNIQLFGHLSSEMETEKKTQKGAGSERQFEIKKQSVR